MSSDRIGAVLIAGPTASGKSALALRIARETGGALVNADSMQVYRDLRTLTARPTPEEEGSAQHRLFGPVDGAEAFSAGRYAAAAGTILQELRAADVLPILVGGTGLYFKALTEGLSEMPAVPEQVRDAVRAEAAGRETQALHAWLASRDPATAAQLRSTDRQRVLRALEVLAATGLPLSTFQGARRPGPLADVPALRIFVRVDRSELRTRIDGRFVRMVENGALDEAARLAARGLDPALPVMRAHGVPGLLAHLRGETGLDEAIRRGQADTRAYAKRQLTWFRHQMPDFEALDPEAAYEAAMRRAVSSSR